MPATTSTNTGTTTTSTSRTTPQSASNLHRGPIPAMLEPYKRIPTEYNSRAVSIPEGFLVDDPPDAKPMSAQRIDFSKTVLRDEYVGYYGIILDNVLSASECTQLLQLAESSSLSSSSSSSSASSEGVSSEGEGHSSAWGPALVSSGPGMEMLVPEYRNSDRIVWDEAEIASRLWARCCKASSSGSDSGSLRRELACLDAKKHSRVLGPARAAAGQRWRFSRLNERLRFLRYGVGQFFRQHCDGAYVDRVTGEMSFYTLHLYLNDSLQGVAATEKKSRCKGGDVKRRVRVVPGDEDNSREEEKGDDITERKKTTEKLLGGATTFWSGSLEKGEGEEEEEGRRLDVEPMAGRVLIFQHRGLLHSGDDVVRGVKYTMRTDLMFMPVKDDDDKAAL
ncbi:MAG: hypothetical protein M1825_000247 [Sarcosagium campestre]|nr:MAG: hypothetical protein M1825_000247 [Sarcosagium campestre]